MLLVQEYLGSGKSLSDLENELGISASYHPTLPLIILNYSQLDSPKTHPIVRECRSLILELTSWKIVSRSFFRFFNLGEALEITQKFNWANYRTYEKVDGSLCHLFYYERAWHMATRSTFGQLKMNEEEFTWGELFWKAMGDAKNNVDRLDKEFSYILELCSPYNQVVTYHPEPKVFLLDVVYKSHYHFFYNRDIDIHIQCVNTIANKLGVSRPKIYNLNDKKPEELNGIVDAFANQDEGIVCQDDKGERIKVKNKGWFALAQLSNNNSFYYKDLYDLVIKGDSAEVCLYYPLAKKKCELLEETIHHTIEKLEIVWALIKHIEVQKDFALTLFKYNPPLAWVLFECRRHKAKIADFFKPDSSYYEKVKKGILETING